MKHEFDMHTLYTTSKQHRAHFGTAYIQPILGQYRLDRGPVWGNGDLALIVLTASAGCQCPYKPVDEGSGQTLCL